LPSKVDYKPRSPFKDDAGAMNNVSNWTFGALRDGTRWTPTKEYRPTLSDLTFNYWATDLQPNVDDGVLPITRVKGTEVVGGTDVPEFWNPKNDPATWQHMTTSIIGFGSAARWSKSPVIDASAAQPTYSGDYEKLVSGGLNWLDPLKGSLLKLGNGSGYVGLALEQVGYLHEPGDLDAVRMDLWHSAINGRGTFTPASNAKALSDAFKTILADIKAPKDALYTSIVADSSKFKTEQFFYRASYAPKFWTGDVQASKFAADGALKAQWSAKSLLDEKVKGDGFSSQRTVLSSSAAGGIAFRWDNLSDTQKGALQGAPIIPATNTPGGRGQRTTETTAGQTALNFLRGERAREGTSFAGERWRARNSVLGDIVGSTVWYAGKPNDGFLSAGYSQFSANKAGRAAMLYVGANDGMLHAFNATSGDEAFAYVPQGLYGTAGASLLRQLATSGYAHHYFVDGSPFVGDVYLGAASDAASPDATKVKQWKSLLVGTLGAGGKGYFVLDVTDPGGVSEDAAGSVVLIDTTATTDADSAMNQPFLPSEPPKATPAGAMAR
jgi:type IV pilus assembly protein PilY1